MQRRLRQVFCALKEHSSVSYAKIATVGGFCDINLIIVKATPPTDLPLSERYIYQLLKIFTVSPSSFHSFSLGLSSRFAKTRSWRVALKCLLLLHRLLRSLPECSPFRTELLWSRSNGFLSLYPCLFSDNSSSTPDNYNMFIRSYARLLDEALECFCFDSWKHLETESDQEQNYDQEEEEEEGERSLLGDKMKEVGRLLEVLPQLQSLIDRVMNCKPNGVAARSFIIQSAMKYIVRDSFISYTTFRREIVLVLDNLIQMPYRSCVSAFGIYKKAGLQADQLCDFYDWCRARGLCGSYEYPIIDRIPQIQIRALENFLNGMWQLTDSSSSAMSPSSWMETQSNSTEDDGDHQQQKVVRGGVIVMNTDQWEKFEEKGFCSRKLEGTTLPLIQLEDDENENWEAVLDASLSVDDSRHGYCVYGQEIAGEEISQKWQMQVYNPNFNPFCHP